MDRYQVDIVVQYTTNGTNEAAPSQEILVLLPYSLILFNPILEVHFANECILLLNNLRFFALRDMIIQRRQHFRKLGCDSLLRPGLGGFFNSDLSMGDRPAERCGKDLWEKSW